MARQLIDSRAAEASRLPRTGDAGTGRLGRPGGADSDAGDGDAAGLGECRAAAAGDLRHRRRHPVGAHGHAAAGHVRKPNGDALPLRHRVGVRGRGQLAPAAAARGARLPADGRSRRSSCDDPQKKEKRAQFERVEAFFARFRNADGSLKGGVNEYATPERVQVAAAPAPGGDSVSPPAACPPMTANRRRSPPTIPAAYVRLAAAQPAREVSCWARRRRAMRSP